MAEFEQDVDIFCVFEEVLEADDMVLVERAMDLDLGHELLLGTSFGQCALHDDLGCADSLVLQVRELKAASEATFTQKLALEILLNAYLAVVFYDFFLNDGLGPINAFFGM